MRVDGPRYKTMSGGGCGMSIDPWWNSNVYTDQDSSYYIANMTAVFCRTRGSLVQTIPRGHTTSAADERAVARMCTVYAAAGARIVAAEWILHSPIYLPRPLASRWPISTRRRRGRRRIVPAIIGRLRGGRPCIRSPDRQSVIGRSPVHARSVPRRAGVNVLRVIRLCTVTKIRSRSRDVPARENDEGCLPTHACAHDGFHLHVSVGWLVGWVNGVVSWRAVFTGWWTYIYIYIYIHTWALNDDDLCNGNDGNDDIDAWDCDAEGVSACQWWSLTRWNTMEISTRLSACTVRCSTSAGYQWHSRLERRRPISLSRNEHNASGAYTYNDAARHAWCLRYLWKQQKLNAWRGYGFFLDLSKLLPDTQHVFPFTCPVNRPNYTVWNDRFTIAYSAWQFSSSICRNKSHFHAALYNYSEEVWETSTICNNDKVEALMFIYKSAANIRCLTW